MPDCSHSIVRRFTIQIALTLGLALTAGCGSGSSSESSTSSNRPSSSSSSSTSISSSASSASSSQTTSLTVTLDHTQRFQKVSGFGGALPMWTTNYLTDEEVQTLVGQGEKQLGLTILRSIIRPNPDDWGRAVDNLQQAQAHSDEVTLLATPWSPPAEWKDNGALTNGGRLLEEYYDDYAYHLNDYVTFMADRGVTIDIVSIQNEPDWHPDYESGDWSGEDIRRFIVEHGDKIEADVMIGESLRFERAYTDPSLNDDQALEQFEIVGGHIYARSEWDLNFIPYPLAEEKGKEIWMTEWNFHEADGDGDGMPIWSGNNADVWDETLDVVIPSVHRAMVSNWNAYIWWWARRFYSFIGDGDAQYGTERGEVLKRGWAFSHYAKYVRPGDIRIGATKNPDDNVDVTAYDSEGKSVVVLINRGYSELVDVEIDAEQDYTEGRGVVTSRFENRSPLEVIVQNGAASVTSIPARSIVTVELFDAQP